MQAEKDRARQLKQMQEGTSAQAKRDIARLDQIKRDREEAAKRREMERKGNFSLLQLPPMVAVIGTMDQVCYCFLF